MFLAGKNRDSLTITDKDDNVIFMITKDQIIIKDGYNYGFDTNCFTIHDDGSITAHVVDFDALIDATSKGENK